MKIKCSTQSGSVRLILFFVIAMAGCFWKGGQDLFTAISNRQPMTVSYDGYLRTKPHAAWLRLTNCELDLSRAAYHSMAGAERPFELFVPVERRDAADEEKI